jgi:transcription elongation factor GreA
MPPSFLTPNGYQKLQDELAYLRTEKRQEVAARLHEAMEDGGDMGVDLDAEYEAAKNEQAFVEGRIQELEILLANARVIENSGNRDVVDIGANVKVVYRMNPHWDALSWRSDPVMLLRLKRPVVLLKSK